MLKEREYHLKIHSISRFAIAVIVIFLSSIFLIIDILPHSDNEIILIVKFFAAFIGSFYLAHLIGMGKAKVLFTNEGFVHVWQRRFILNWEKNFKIPWNMVDDYVFQEDRTCDSFIINLTNKTRYKINRFNIFPIKDDFQRLVKDFPKLSNEYKKGLISDNQTNSIKEGESIYASISFRWVFNFMLAIFLFLTLDKVFNPDSEIRWSALGVIGNGLLFYGLMIKEQKKHK